MILLMMISLPRFAHSEAEEEIVPLSASRKCSKQIEMKTDEIFNSCGSQSIQDVCDQGESLTSTDPMQSETSMSHKGLLEKYHEQSLGF